MLEVALGEKEAEIGTETITFNIQKDLKKRFQIKVIGDNSSMTEKLNEFIKNYVI